MVVKHVSTEELQAIPAAADDRFIIGGKDALVKKQQVQHILISCIAFFCAIVLCGECIVLDFTTTCIFHL